MESYSRRFRSRCDSNLKWLTYHEKISSKLPSILCFNRYHHFSHFRTDQHIPNRGLLEALNKFPMIEELELSLCKHVFRKVYEGIGIAYPHLKCLKVSYPCFYSTEDIKYNKYEEALGIATMFVLCSLQLFGSELTNSGLTKILDNCSHLDYLDIHH
ncbi:hypothetical protein ZWY2020_058239 [Hordeum vulgare]|nr:hypothetical protein ZWY2020_058239 [Hordeum vulgare]